MVRLRVVAGGDAGYEVISGSWVMGIVVVRWFLVVSVVRSCDGLSDRYAEDPGHPDVCAVIPRRADLPAERGVLRVSAICIDRNPYGFLFAASEFGNRAVYQFRAIGIDPDVESSSTTSMEADEGFQPILFKPRGLKKSFCGRGPRSSLRILRPGLAISELAVAQLLGVPSAVWTVKKNINDEFDSYIVVSFANATLVLSIGGETVEEWELGHGYCGCEMVSGRYCGEVVRWLTRIRIDPTRNEHDNVFEHTLDPKGRALMIGACEKQKLVYMLNRDSAANLTISSPLEAHKSCTVAPLSALIAVGIIQFASLELDYSEPNQGKHLTFYELDLGLNNVYRKSSHRVDDGANMLVAVPGGGDGPSGVLVCAENVAFYKNQDPGHPDVCAYFDTVPTASAMCVMKSDGFLFAASEFGNHAVYQFRAIGIDPDVESSSTTSMEADEGFQPILFKPRGLKNVVRIDPFESLMPIMGMKAVNLFEEETPQIFTVGGRGPRDDSLMQVHPTGIRHIREDGRIDEWRTPGKQTIVKVLNLQNVSSPPESLLFLEVEASLFLSVGLQSGVLFRTVVDMVTGQLSNGLSRFLGLRAPKLLSVLVRGRAAMICLSSRPWLGYVHQGLFHLTPLTYVTLEYAASFSSAQCVEGLVAVAGDTLRVVIIEKIGETFNEVSIPLRYTPRKFVLHPKRELLVTIESDQGAFPAELRESAKKECIEADGQRDNGKMEIENDGDGDDTFSDEQYGYPKAESDKWVSCIRVLDPKSTETTLGTAKDLQFWPKRSLTAGYIHIYWFVQDGRSLELLHKTQVDGVPLALCQFQGRLLVGIESRLRLYDLGKEGCLERDIQESFYYCKYVRDENQLYVYADDSDVSDEIEEGPGSIKREQGMLNKVEEIVQFHVGDVVTCMQKASLNPRGVECLVYGTELPRLCGRDHMAYRSAYYPVKDVIDGDLCEQYHMLTLEKQRKIAVELDATRGKILKKLEDVRNKERSLKDSLPTLATITHSLALSLIYKTMKMKKKVYKKSSSSSSSSSSSVHPLIISDHHHLSVVLPAAIFSLTLSLSQQDKHVLAYLLSSSSSTSNNKTNKKTTTSAAADHSPVFTCKCFSCYMSYWALWDSSPNQNLIHHIIDAFEDTTTLLLQKNDKTKNKPSFVVTTTA
nr:hypothetical protein [Tanacetum cinerariifolium]